MLQVLNETTMTWNAANPPLLKVSRMAPLKPVVLIKSHAAGLTRLCAPCHLRCMHIMAWPCGHSSCSNASMLHDAAGPLRSFGTVAARQIVMFHSVQWRRYFLELHGTL
jgi:hypothetical protein